jgi:thioredoxin 1
MKRIFLVLFLALFFSYIADTSWAMGTKPAPSAKDTVTVKKQAKTDSTTVTVSTIKTNSAKAKNQKLPKLVDLGADKCIPCKMMAPILEELKKEYAGKLDVVFIDVWKSADEGSKYKIRVIPTQIFYSDEGKELFRHEGFYAKDDILAKWKELGYELKK